MAKKKKQPKRGVVVSPFAKVPRGAELLDSIRARKFCWRVRDVDWKGPWGWSNSTLEELFWTIIPRLHDYESMTWAEIDGPCGSHSVGIEDLCTEAQDQLKKLGMEELESLFSLRITGERRVWGVKDVAVLQILWWDPKHSVCPSGKKHT